MPVAFLGKKKTKKLRSVRKSMKNQEFKHAERTTDVATAEFAKDIKINTLERT